MRSCIVVEGAYPYVMGGVSNWVHDLIRLFPDTGFSVLAIVPDRSYRGRFVYELPENVTEVREVYVNDSDWTQEKNTALTDEEHEALRSLVLEETTDWDKVFACFAGREISLNGLLMGEDFLHIIMELYDREWPEIPFTDFLWTLRSIYLPLFQTLSLDVPEADIYHCIATGYAGIIGCMGKMKYGGRLILSEHGIYTREREEELIKADWVRGVYKDIWIRLFKKLSQAIYDRADTVVSLFDGARRLQIELGCPEEKTVVIPNGIDLSRFENVGGKTEEDEGYFNIGALLRITPIKDVKTMIQAFALAKKKAPNLKLWIMGPDDEDKEYAKECYDYADYLKVPDLVFTGRVPMLDYIGRMDATILTSLSEGQPLTILEGYAVRKPCIATDVGNCKGLLYGEGEDRTGPAGILTHVMDVEEIAEAMVTMATEPEAVKRMGETGHQRLIRKYNVADMKSAYIRLYNEAYGEHREWQGSGLT